MAVSPAIQILFFVLVGVVGSLAALSALLAFLEAGTGGRPMGSMLFAFCLISDMVALTIVCSRYLYCRTHNVVQPFKQLHLRNIPGYSGLALVTMSSSIAIFSDAWRVVDVLEIAGAVLLFFATPLSLPRGGFVHEKPKARAPQAPQAEELAGEPVLVQPEVVEQVKL